MDGHFAVHALDLPGYGRAPLPTDTAQIGAAANATAVIRTIEALDSPVHLVGHSNGGAIAIKVALMRPGLVKSLTVYEPATFHFLADGDAGEQVLFDQIQEVARALAAACASGDAAPGMERFLDFWNATGFWDALPADAHERFTQLAPSVMADFANGFAETWALSDLARLRMPTLVMTGLESPAIAQHVAVAIAKALPNARLALLPELGHMAPVFQPEWVNSRIFEHVANVERPVANISWPDRVAA